MVYAMKNSSLDRVRDWLRGALRSLTVWFNSVAGLLIVSLPEIERTLPQLSTYLGPELYKWLAIAVVLSNLALRAKTNKSLSEKGQP
jgi:hypothetical protein